MDPLKGSLGEDHPCTLHHWIEPGLQMFRFLSEPIIHYNYATFLVNNN